MDFYKRASELTNEKIKVSSATRGWERGGLGAAVARVLPSERCGKKY
jgi:hypothetical protein